MPTLEKAVRRPPTDQSLAEREVLLALKTRMTGRSELRTLGGFYQQSAKDRDKALKHAPESPEQLETGEKWLASYAHGRGFVEGVELALRSLCGPEAVAQFKQYYLPKKEGK